MSSVSSDIQGYQGICGQDSKSAGCIPLRVRVSPSVPQEKRPSAILQGVCCICRITPPRKRFDVIQSFSKDATPENSRRQVRQKPSSSATVQKDGFFTSNRARLQNNDMLSGSGTHLSCNYGGILGHLSGHHGQRRKCCRTQRPKQALQDTFFSWDQVSNHSVKIWTHTRSETPNQAKTRDAIASRNNTSPFGFPPCAKPLDLSHPSRIDWIHAIHSFMTRRK